MNDRTLYGPDGPEFRAWMQRNDPEAACMKREAAIIAARLDDVLQESIRISPLEVLLLATFSEQVQVERDFIASCDAIVSERKRQDAAKRRRLQRSSIVHPLGRCAR